MRRYIWPISWKRQTAFREQHSEVEWADIVGFRNIAVHEYFAVSWSIVWVTAMHDVPNLRRKVARILAEKYAEE